MVPSHIFLSSRPRTGLAIAYIEARSVNVNDIILLTQGYTSGEPFKYHVVALYL